MERHDSRSAGLHSQRVRFAGFLSDQLRPEFGIESIRYSLLIVAVGGNVWAALHYYLASQTLREDPHAKDR